MVPCNKFNVIWCFNSITGHPHVKSAFKYLISTTHNEALVQSHLKNVLFLLYILYLLSEVTANIQHNQQDDQDGK